MKETAMDLVLGLLLLSLPMTILVDSRNRLGKRSWGWALGMLVLAFMGFSVGVVALLFTGYLSSSIGGSFEGSRAANQVTELIGLAIMWVFCFAIYRLATRRKAPPTTFGTSR